jgi:predicted PhzF superfamily epimerase YddE/YHI9
MIPLFVIDAFADKPFAGNPAAICFLEAWPPNQRLQLVAREMNLSETAFLVHREDNEFDLRWFTPRVEVALCGHATLASAHALWESGRANDGEIGFHTKSGRLTANPLSTGEIELDFPARPARPCESPMGLLDSLGTQAVAVGRNETDYLVEVANEDALRTLRPDFERLSRVECRGVIVTSRANDPRFDFLSRFFAPQSGVNEDPVTGSAHCCLAEYWGEKLGKSEMLGYQASERGGVVRVTRDSGRVKLAGRTVTVARGELVAAIS